MIGAANPRQWDFIAIPIKTSTLQNRDTGEACALRTRTAHLKLLH
jgi:hypothetical protein